MRIFLCRWPNGDFSVVTATSRGDAIDRLDEAGDAETALIQQLDELLVHFTVSDDGEIQLADRPFGELTEDVVDNVCYPVLAEARAEIDEGAEPTPERLERIRAAVIEERERITPKDGPEPATELAADIKRRMGAPTRVVDRMVATARRKALEGRR
jgi:hypothetical protein